MTIDKVEWGKGRTEETLESKVEKFLSNHKDNAYTASEISNSLYNIQVNDLGSFVMGFLTLSAVDTALKNLIREGTVKAKVVKQSNGTNTYYIIK